MTRPNKTAAIIAAFALATSLASCSTEGSSATESAESTRSVEAPSTKRAAPPVHVAADKYTGVVPNLLDQNVAQATYYALNESFRVQVGNGNLLVRLINPDGVLITEENAANYKIVSQDPAAGTTFEMTYALDSDGKEYDNLVDTQGIEEIVVNVEPIG